MERSTVILRVLLLQIVTHHIWAAPTTLNNLQDVTTTIKSHTTENSLFKDDVTTIKNENGRLSPKKQEMEKFDAKNKESFEKTKGFDYQNNILNNALMSSLPILRLVNDQTNFDVNLMDSSFKMSPTVHIINNMNKKEANEVNDTQETKLNPEKLLINALDSLLSNPLPPFHVKEEGEIRTSNRIYPNNTRQEQTTADDLNKSSLNTKNIKTTPLKQSNIKINTKIESLDKTENIKKIDLDFPSIKANEQERYATDSATFSTNPTPTITKSTFQNDKTQKQLVIEKSTSESFNENSSGGFDKEKKIPFYNLEWKDNKNLISKNKQLDNGPGLNTESNLAATSHDSAAISQGREESKNIHAFRQTSSVNVTSAENNKKAINVNNLNSDNLSHAASSEEEIDISKRPPGITNAHVGFILNSHGEKKSPGSPLSNTNQPIVVDNIRGRSKYNDGTSDKILYVVENEKASQSISDTEYNLQNLPSEFFKNVPRKLSITPDKTVQSALERELNTLSAFTKLSEFSNTPNDKSSTSIPKTISEHDLPQTTQQGITENHNNVLNISKKPYDKEIVSLNHTRNIKQVNNRNDAPTDIYSSTAKIEHNSHVIETTSKTNLLGALDKGITEIAIPVIENISSSLKEINNVLSKETLKTGIKNEDQVNFEKKSNGLRNQIQNTNTNTDNLKIVDIKDSIETNFTKDLQATLNSGTLSEENKKQNKPNVKWIQIEPIKLDLNSTNENKSTLSKNLGSEQTIHKSNSPSQNREGKTEILNSNDHKETLENSKVFRIVSSRNDSLTENKPENGLNENPRNRNINYENQNPLNRGRISNTKNSQHIKDQKEILPPSSVNLKQQSNEYLPKKDSKITENISKNLKIEIGNTEKSAGLETVESNYYGQFNRQYHNSRENKQSETQASREENGTGSLRISLNNDLSKESNSGLLEITTERKEIGKDSKTQLNTNGIKGSVTERSRQSQHFLGRNHNSRINFSPRDESSLHLNEEETDANNFDNGVRGSKKYKPTKFETLSPFTTDSQTSQIYSDVNPSSKASNYYVTPRSRIVTNPPQHNTLLSENSLPKVTDIQENSGKTQSSRPYRGNIRFKYEPSNYDWYDDVNYPTQFSYRYKAPNDTSVYQKGILKEINSRKVFVVQGSYKYTAPDGTPILVTYTADENGFHPQETVLDSNESEEVLNNESKSEELESDILLDGIQNTLAAREFRKVEETPVEQPTQGSSPKTTVRRSSKVIRRRKT